MQRHGLLEADMCSHTVTQSHKATLEGATDLWPGGGCSRHSRVVAFFTLAHFWVAPRASVEALAVLFQALAALAATPTAVAGGGSDLQAGQGQRN